MVGAVLAAGVVATPATAPVADDFAIDIPAGFSERPAMAKRLAATTGIAGASVNAWAYVAEAGGAGIYVTAAKTRAPAAGAGAENPASVARAVLAEVRSAPEAASPEAGSTETISWKLGEGENFLDAHHQWRHLSNETTTLTRALVYVDADDGVHLVRADCVIGSAAPASLTSMCETTLASLHLTGPASSRKPLPAMAIEAGGDTAAAAAAPALTTGGQPLQPGSAALYVGGAGGGISPWWLAVAGGAGMVLGGIGYGVWRSRRQEPASDD